MKIQNIHSNPQTSPKSISPQGTTEADSFQKLLHSKIEQSVKTQAVTQTTTNFQISPDPALRLEGLALTETTLSTLDSYGQALETLSFSPAELEPLVEALEEETAALIDLKQELPPEDPLTHLLDRVATLSYVESVKYRRGDYSA